MTPDMAPKGSPGAAEALTARQRRIHDFISETVRDRGYPPTVREIGEAVGLTSSSSVHAQLANLVRRGLLRKDPTKPRAMTLSENERAAGVVVPLVGRIAAGGPICTVLATAPNAAETRVRLAERTRLVRDALDAAAIGTVGAPSPDLWRAAAPL